MVEESKVAGEIHDSELVSPLVDERGSMRPQDAPFETLNQKKNE